VEELKPRYLEHHMRTGGPTTTSRKVAYYGIPIEARPAHALLEDLGRRRPHPDPKKIR